MLPPSLNLLNDDDDDDDDNDDKSFAESMDGSSVRGRGRGAHRNSLAGPVPNLRSRSSSVQGRAPRPSVPDLNTVPQTPNTQRKTLGLAAMLYSKPDEFSCQVAGDEDGGDSKNKSGQMNVDGSQSPTSVTSNEPEVDPAVAAEMEKKAKLQQKKDYWKAQLSGKR
jgi:hypothetical protein